MVVWCKQKNIWTSRFLLVETVSYISKASPSPAAIKESACPGDKTTSSLIPST